MRTYYTYMLITFITVFIFSSCGKIFDDNNSPEVDIIEPTENSEFVKNTQIEFKVTTTDEKAQIIINFSLINVYWFK